MKQVPVRWDLGNDLMEETNVYKYLGVYFSRSLKLSHRNIHKGKYPEKTKFFDTNFGRTR